MDCDTVFELENERILNELYSTNKPDVLHCSQCGQVDFNGASHFDNSWWQHPHQCCEEFVCGTVCAADWCEENWSDIDTYNQNRGK